MEPVEYTARPTTIKAYQFLLENANEFIEMLWGWNYLTRLSGRSLTFKSAGAPPTGEIEPMYGIYEGQYLIESSDPNGLWKIEIMDAAEFEKKFMPFIPQTDGVE